MPSSSKSGRLRGEVKAVLARWALRRRHSDGSVQWPSEDEATHVWDGRRRFEEDYTFAAVQPGLALIVRLARVPGREAQRVWVWLLRPDRACGYQKLVPWHSGEPWRAGGVELDCLTPYRAWSVAFAGALTETSPTASDERSVAIEAKFVAEHPPFSPGTDDEPSLLARRLSEATWDRVLLREVRRAQTRGYVQFGRFEGTLRVDDALIPLRAACWRQHRWGVLDWGGSDHAFQCFVVDAHGRPWWMHRAAFPFVTLEGGCVSSSTSAGWTDHPLIPLAALERVGPWQLAVESQIGHAAWTLRSRASAEFMVDGRGAIALHLVEGEAGTWGVWADQRRSLARPEGPSAGRTLTPNR